jgi:hypothetical protein
LPMWGDDTQQEADRVTDIFRSFAQWTIGYSLGNPLCG